MKVKNYSITWKDRDAVEIGIPGSIPIKLVDEHPHNSIDDSVHFVIWRVLQESLEWLVYIT